MKFIKIKAMLGVCIILLASLLNGCAYENVSEEEIEIVESDYSDIENYLVAIVTDEGNVKTYLLKAEGINPYYPPEKNRYYSQTGGFDGNVVCQIDRKTGKVTTHSKVYDIVPLETLLPIEIDNESLTDANYMDYYNEYVVKDGTVYDIPSVKEYTEEYKLLKAVEEAEQDFLKKQEKDGQIIINGADIVIDALSEPKTLTKK